MRIARLIAGLLFLAAAVGVQLHLIGPNLGLAACEVGAWAVLWFVARGGRAGYLLLIGAGALGCAHLLLFASNPDGSGVPLVSDWVLPVAGVVFFLALLACTVGLLLTHVVARWMGWLGVAAAVLYVPMLALYAGAELWVDVFPRVLVFQTAVYAVFYAALSITLATQVLSTTAASNKRLNLTRRRLA